MSASLGLFLSPLSDLWQPENKGTRCLPSLLPPPIVSWFFSGPGLCSRFGWSNRNHKLPVFIPLLRNRGWRNWQSTRSVLGTGRRSVKAQPDPWGTPDAQVTLEPRCPVRERQTRDPLYPGFHHADVGLLSSNVWTINKFLVCFQILAPWRRDRRKERGRGCSLRW